MNYTILDKIQDIAGKWRLTIKVENAPNNFITFMLKFQTDPTVEEVDIAVINYVNNFNADHTNPEVLAMREKYLEATQQLCFLAGIEYTGKLQNIDYERIAILASQANNPLYPLILTSILYCRTVLKELDGDNWWDNI